MLHKSHHPLTTLDDWQHHAGPKSPVHWQDFRSAKETARHWLAALPALPADVSATLASHPDFSPVTDWSAEPELQLRFDGRRGEPRNTDLLVLARDAHGPFVVAVEAKADETFGQPVAEAVADALERLAANPRSGGVARIADLVASLLPEATSGAATVTELRYQLLTASAGVLAYAKAHYIARAVLLVQEFVTPKTTDARHAANADDLDRWLHRVSSGRFAKVGDGELLGPITVPGEPLFPEPPALYVGKTQVHLRPAALETTNRAAAHGAWMQTSVPTNDPLPRLIAHLQEPGVLSALCGQKQQQTFNRREQLLEHAVAELMRAEPTVTNVTVTQQLGQTLGVRAEQYPYRTRPDLVVERGDQLSILEVKSGRVDYPRFDRVVGKDMQAQLEALGLSTLQPTEVEQDLHRLQQYRAVSPRVASATLLLVDAYAGNGRSWTRVFSDADTFAATMQLPTIRAQAAAFLAGTTVLSLDGGDLPARLIVVDVPPPQ